MGCVDRLLLQTKICYKKNSFTISNFITIVTYYNILYLCVKLYYAYRYQLYLSLYYDLS